MVKKMRPRRYVSAGCLQYDLSTVRSYYYQGSTEADANEVLEARKEDFVVASRYRICESVR